MQVEVQKHELTILGSANQGEFVTFVCNSEPWVPEYRMKRNQWYELHRPRFITVTVEAGWTDEPKEEA